MEKICAYLLVFHGSQDPRSQTAAKSLTESFRQKIQLTQQVPQALGQTSKLLSSSASAPAPDSTIGVQDAYLECHPLPLHQQIQQFVETTQAAVPNLSLQVKLVPVFLLAGVHVMEDIPAEVALAQAEIGTTSLEVVPYLGSQMGLNRLINEYLSAQPMEAWILMAHGSRRGEANRAIENLADRVGAIAAFWFTEPSLETQLQELATLGFRRIGIFPYFLFSGGTTDAIAQTVADCAQKFPDLTLTLSPPLNAIPELADVLVLLAINGKR